MNEKLTLKKLTEVVNEYIELDIGSLYSSRIKDNRKKDSFSERRIRDLTSKGLISSPVREGRNVYYSQIHIDELLEYKKMQANGHTEASVKLAKNSELSSYSESNSSLLNLIKNIEDSSIVNPVIGGSSLSGSSLGFDNIQSLDLDQDNIEPSRTSTLGLGGRSVLYSLDKTGSDIPVIENKSYKISENITLNINTCVDKDELEKLEEAIKNIKNLYK